MNVARVVCLVIYRLHEFNILKTKIGSRSRMALCSAAENEYIPPTIAIIHSNQILTMLFKI